MKPQSEKAVAVAVAEGEMPRGGGNGDAVKDAGEKILGYVVKYAGETFKAKLVNNSGEKPEGDAVKDAGDEILCYVVKYAGESLKAELVDKSGQKLQRDAVKDAGDEIQGCYVVKSAGETLEAELVNRSGEKLQADNGETRKADVGEKSTDPIKGKADSSGTIKAEPAKICNKADAPETPKANSIQGCAGAETVRNIDGEEGGASKDEDGDESQEEGGDEPEEKEDGDESKEKEEGDGSKENEEGDGSEEQEVGDESEEEDEGDESEEEEEEEEEEDEDEDEDEEEGQAIEVNTQIELMDILNGWMGGRLLIRVGRLPSMAEAGRLYTYINTLGGLVEVANIEVLKMVSDLEGLIELKVIKATIPTLREHPQQAAARGYLAKQGRQLVGRGIQIGGEFRARAEAVGNAMQVHSQLVNEPPYSVALNNLRKTLNTLLNSPVTLA